MMNSIPGLSRREARMTSFTTGNGDEDNDREAIKITRPIERESASVRSCRLEVYVWI